MYRCDDCEVVACAAGEAAGAPHGCPSPASGREAIVARYRDPEDGLLARCAALVEAHGYCRLTRVEEIMDFAGRCGFTRLGLAFCIGLHAEAAIVARIFRANGFTVDSVACKNGAVPKELLGLTRDDKLRPDEFESMCNPIGQAAALARAGTELNILLGLCVGHDSLFMRHSAAPVTVLAAKDRVLGHNPLAAVYLADGYYRRKLFPSGPGPGSDPVSDAAG